MTRRDLLACAALALACPLPAAARRWPLGLNTYCLRFQGWNDRQLIDYCAARKLDAIFLQDSLDPGVMDPRHWADVRAWTREAGLRLETGGGALLSKTRPAERAVADLRRNIERSKAMGSPIVRALMAGDRYSLPDDGPVEKHMEAAAAMLREVRTQALDAGVKIAIENHKDLQAWQTRQLIEAAGKDFVGSYLDTGNPVFVAEHPLTTIEELGPYAVSFHLRDSVVCELPEGIAVQWVPLGEGTLDFHALVARAAELLPPGVSTHCKPITGRPPVVLPVYTDEFWTKWFPRARTRDFERFVALAKRGRPYQKAQLTADVPGDRERYMDALKRQQLEHMEQGLTYCRAKLGLGMRAAS